MILAAPVGLAALYRQPQLWLRLFVPAVAIVAPVGAYNDIVFGSFLGGLRMLGGDFALANLPSGLLGSFFSPARGLFLYFPAALLAFILMARRACGLSRNPLFLALLACIVLASALNASYSAWYGGHCFGPRYFTEVQGLILILLGAALEGSAQHVGVAALCLAFIVPYSIFIQIMGSFSWTTITWNAVPNDVNHQLSRLWDWNDNPIFRGVRANFK